jgi:regulator of replication initiation timing
MNIESVPGSSMTYNDVYDLVTELRKDIKAIEASLGKSLDSCFEEVKETKDLISKQSAEVSKLLAQVDKLNSENIALRNRVVILENRLDECEQYSRRETIEIHGVPMEPNEQVLEVVKQVGKSLDIAIEDNMISACHRLRGRDNNGKPPGIIVKMVRRFDAERIIERRRVKRNLSTHDIGLTSRPAVPIYINESLSPGRRRLLNAAREKKREKSYTYLWIRGGKILMRKADGEPVRAITCSADLDKL